MTEDLDALNEYLQSQAEKMLPPWNELPDIELYMDQLTGLVNRYLGNNTKDRMLTPAMVNNYVKMKVMPAPVKKKYGRVHLMYLLLICILKQIMPLSSVEAVLRSGLEQAEPERFYENVRRLYAASFQEAAGIAETMIGQGEMLHKMTLALALKAHAEQALAQGLLEL